MRVSPAYVAPLEDGDRALRQVRPVRVLELEAEQRVLGLHGRVVDADPRALDVLVDDRQQGRLLPGQRRPAGRSRTGRSRPAGWPSPPTATAARGPCRCCSSSADFARRTRRRLRRRSLQPTCRSRSPRPRPSARPGAARRGPPPPAAAAAAGRRTPRVRALPRRRRPAASRSRLREPAVVGRRPQRGEQLRLDRRPRHVQRVVQVHLERDRPAATPGPSSPPVQSSSVGFSTTAQPCRYGLPVLRPAPAGSSSSRSGSRPRSRPSPSACPRRRSAGCTAFFCVSWDRASISRARFELALEDRVGEPQPLHLGQLARARSPRRTTGSARRSPSRLVAARRHASASRCR